MSQSTNSEELHSEELHSEELHSEEKHSEEKRSEEKHSEDLRLLAEIAFTGVFYGLAVHARDIFDYIEQYPEHREVGVLGKGLALISDGKFSDASKLIEKDVLEKNPESLEGQLFAALALKLEGKSSHAERLSERAVKNGSETAKQFSENLRSVSYAQIRPNY